MKRIFFQNHKWKSSLIGLISLAFQPAFSQNSIFGTVKDAETGETLPFSMVKILDSYNLCYTNLDGVFSFDQLKHGKYLLVANYLGYLPDTLEAEIVQTNVELNFELHSKSTQLPEILISSLSSNYQRPTAFTNLTAKDIETRNVAQDLPYLLNFTPSVVVSSDAGAGVGYTGIRVRGSDPTRINVTVNGIPINDSESHSTYWVNMPDFASSTEQIQIQRGAGGSTNGAGSFGATVNLQTQKVTQEPYAMLSNSYGSFQTRKHTLTAGTGMLNNHWNFDVRLSQIYSEGYIDRAKTDLKSFFVSGGYYGKNNSLTFNIFSGKEKTYQAWNGVPESRLKNNLDGMRDFATRNGLDSADAYNLFNSGARTYNSYTYDDETDNYQQDHYQLFYNHQIKSNLSVHLALHLTNGGGFYEQYKKYQSLEKYGIEPVITGLDTIYASDLIRRRWLLNTFYGTVWNIQYRPIQRLQLNWGGSVNSYIGSHFGEVIWARFAGNSEIRKRYYDNDGKKTDVNSYFKADMELYKGFHVFADMQVRSVSYSFLGYNANLENTTQQFNAFMFNPKGGMSWQINSKRQVYLSIFTAKREPTRDDFTQSSPQSRPKIEEMTDVEAGYSYRNKSISFQANFYYMHYKNQLVLTGKINDVGAYIRTNIPKSYRGGIELQLACKIGKYFVNDANFSVSQNKVLNYTEFVDDWDTWSQYTIERGNTDISFSPNVVAGNQFSFLFKNFQVQWLSKYVGKQYLDNSGLVSRSLDAWWVNDLIVSYKIPIKKVKDLRLSFQLNNFLNQKYESNGWSYTYRTNGQEYSDNYYFPQAGMNWMTALVIKW